MEKFWEVFDDFFTKLWNWLYELVCEKFGGELNEDYYVDTVFPDYPVE